MDFMALNDDVAAVDQEGRTLLYDAEVGALRVLNPILNPMPTSVSLTVGGDLYVLARKLGLCSQVHHCQVLSLEDWLWYPLEQLPFRYLDIIEDPNFNKDKLGLELVDPFEFSAYTAIGDSEIWISTVGVGTYSWETENCKWSKIGDWALLPFGGRAHYVAEHGLWFGLSDKGLCAADLRQKPPAPPVRKFPVLHLWEEEPPIPEAWTLTATSLLPLGSGKLCITRCFRTTDGVKLLPSDYDLEKAKSFAVLAGMEVVDHAGTGSLEIIKHNSVCYSVAGNVLKLL
jgi:hypothetical protein